MALRAVPDHPKFADLKARLGVPKCIALGCLEALWHFCSRFTPQGNIGKYSDSAIEAWIEWNGEPGKLIQSLIDARWIDRHHDYRLVVHDWHEYSDELVHTDLARRCLTFATGSLPKTGRLNKQERDRFRLWSDSLPAPAGLKSDLSQTNLAEIDNLPAVIQTKSATATKPEPEPEPEPEPAYTQEANLRVFPPPKKPVPAGEEFLRAWERWPLKTHQDEACRAWLSVVDSPSREADIFAALERFEASDQWARGVYERMDRWLFRSGWNDRPPARAGPVESKQDKISERIALAVREAARQRESRRDSNQAGQPLP